jgi:hypothetical protein
MSQRSDDLYSFCDSISCGTSAKNIRVVLAVKGDMHWAPSYYPKKTRTDDCPDWHQSFSLCVPLDSLVLQLQLMLKHYSVAGATTTCYVLQRRN